ncbi:citrate synthase [Paraburkholderia sp. CNPSo 3157]|uniref:citrate synthase (unknown stereospecificity) n=1 Tax=Paraburkholderia franconis TaxID=2654983 RepID=A0A7X1TIR9_9BURK|nr:citrate synthase [Paraburkholderia franconis]MPW20788.1 citrate synthase [Paraburkholderia franconis]
MQRNRQDGAAALAHAPGDYLTRAETLALLQIKLQTLYAYVSRGWIRSVPQGDKGRRLYARQDVERMKSRADARSGHAPVAAAAMRWGEPIISSTLTEITAQGPRYRGVAALDMARDGQTFEAVVKALWNTGDDITLSWQPCARTLRFADAWPGTAGLQPRRELVRFFADIALRFGSEHLRGVRSSDVQFVAASRMIATMAHCLGHLRRPHDGAAATSARKRGGGLSATLLAVLGGTVSPQHIAALDAALVLCADHELAQATFVARIAASAGADVGECVAAAILTQTGLTSARSYEATEDLLRACKTVAQAQRLFEEHYAAHRNLPGFNHPLYPDGDPRARYLIDVVRRLAGRHPSVEPLFAALDIAAKHGCLPSLEIGLTLLTIALGLPPRSAFALFIISRSAGWVAHIVEQRTSGALIRPRADYLQTCPASSNSAEDVLPVDGAMLAAESHT